MTCLCAFMNVVPFEDRDVNAGVNMYVVVQFYP